MKYSLSSDTWDKKELEAIQQVIKGGRYTMGPRVAQFEREFAKKFDVLVFIVAHPTKMYRDKDGKLEEPNMYNLFDTLHDPKTKRYFGEDKYPY